MMKKYIMVEDLFPMQEFFTYKGELGYLVYYCKVKDFKMIQNLVDWVEIEIVIEMDNYLNNLPYLSLRREYSENIPEEIKSIVLMHKNGGIFP